MPHENMTVEPRLPETTHLEGVAKPDAGNGSCPAVVLGFSDVPLAALTAVSLLRGGMYWREPCIMHEGLR